MRSSQAEELLEFLRDHDADTIYLVGDVIDGWSLKGGWYWPQSHNDVVQKILCARLKGARVIYLPGKPRRVPSGLLRHPFRRHRGAGDGDPRDGGRQALSRAARRCVRLRDPPCEVARASGRRGIRPRALPQPHRHSRPQTHGDALLVALRLGEDEGQERGQRHLDLRGRPHQGGAQAGGGRGDLRAYPPCRLARSRRRALPQRRRLGRKPDGDRRASRRAFRDHPLGRTPDACQEAARRARAAVLRPAPSADAPLPA